eukprot:TRINITY_DN100671_c0_g1_i1.p1 TRINITY_DN100671_c0_g1~~TRINITY_DN100671_c0_g1_i1.p1  ORF type:complete len:965 (-),score=200.33 TRINITY_DN100671_c0_g1_i1:129-3023(-)
MEEVCPAGAFRLFLDVPFCLWLVGSCVFVRECWRSGPSSETAPPPPSWHVAAATQTPWQTQQQRSGKQRPPDTERQTARPFLVTGLHLASDSLQLWSVATNAALVYARVLLGASPSAPVATAVSLIGRLPSCVCVLPLHSGSHSMLQALFFPQLLLLGCLIVAAGSTCFGHLMVKLRSPRKARLDSTAMILENIAEDAGLHVVAPLSTKLRGLLPSALAVFIVLMRLLHLSILRTLLLPLYVAGARLTSSAASRSDYLSDAELIAAAVLGLCNLLVVEVVLLCFLRQGGGKKEAKSTPAVASSTGKSVLPTPTTVPRTPAPASQTAQQGSLEVLCALCCKALPHGRHARLPYLSSSAVLLCLDMACWAGTTSALAVGSMLARFVLLVELLYMYSSRWERRTSQMLWHTGSRCILLVHLMVLCPAPEALGPRLSDAFSALGLLLCVCLVWASVGWQLPKRLSRQTRGAPEGLQQPGSQGPSPETEPRKKKKKDEVKVHCPRGFLQLSKLSCQAVGIEPEDYRQLFCSLTNDEAQCFQALVEVLGPKLQQEKILRDVCTRWAIAVQSAEQGSVGYLDRLLSSDPSAEKRKPPPPLPNSQQAGAGTTITQSCDAIVMKPPPLPADKAQVQALNLKKSLLAMKKSQSSGAIVQPPAALLQGGGGGGGGDRAGGERPGDRPQRHLKHKGTPTTSKKDSLSNLGPSVPASVNSFSARSMLSNSSHVEAVLRLQLSAEEAEKVYGSVNGEKAESERKVWVAKEGARSQSLFQRYQKHGSGSGSSSLHGRLRHNHRPQLSGSDAMEQEMSEASSFARPPTDTTSEVDLLDEALIFLHHNSEADMASAQRDKWGQWNQQKAQARGQTGDSKINHFSMFRHTRSNGGDSDDGSINSDTGSYAGSPGGSAYHQSSSVASSVASSASRVTSLDTGMFMPPGMISMRPDSRPVSAQGQDPPTPTSAPGDHQPMQRRW